MDKKQDRDLVGHPSDYGSRTLADEEPQQTEPEDIGRTADGEPRVERGTADSAISHGKSGR
jgi:hypothetical protein